MHTKQSLSDDNASLDEAPPLGSACTDNSDESSREAMNRDDESVNRRWSSSVPRRRGSSEKKPKLGLLTSDDSCNAVDNTLARDDDEPQTRRNGSEQATDLSFGGKISLLTKDVGQNAVQPRFQTDNIVGKDQPSRSNIDGGHRTCEEKLNESFELLTKENSSLIHYKNEKSPDLFADDDEDEECDDGERHDENWTRENDKIDVDAGSRLRSTLRGSGLGTREPECTDASAVHRVDHDLLKRLRMSLAGIPPPPAMTYIDLDANTILAMYHSNAQKWYANHGLCEPDDALTADTHEEPRDGANAPGAKNRALEECLNKPTRSLTELESIEFPELVKHRAHGLHYNRSSVTEAIELLGLKYVERYISAETSSSFQLAHLPSSAKKRNQRLKMLTQSPGRRLSHLARRRAIFSSESLLNTSGSKRGSIVSAAKGAIDAEMLKKLNPHRACNTRQVLLDPKKSDNRRKNKIRTPKRRTPGNRKSPCRRTPGSSAKKLSLYRAASASAKPAVQAHVPATRESSKRALFLSPQNSSGPSVGRPEQSHRSSVGSATKQTDRAMFSEARVLKSKRSLFSPPRGTEAQNRSSTAVADPLGRGPSSSAVSVKRPRSPIADSGDSGGSGERTEKIRRVESSGLTEEDLTPRSLKFARSKSFCVASHGTTGPQTVAPECAPGIGGKTLFRANSEISSADGHRPVMMLTENHKKKLLWAVSQALQSKQITAKHEQFKLLASSLVRVVKRLFLEFNDQNTSSTSEKLLKLANRHVYEVIQGKSVDDIYFREKTRILNARNMPKLQGYIAPEEYEQRKLKRAESTASIVSSEGSALFDSPLSASQSMLSQNSSVLSQGSSFGALSQLSMASGFARGNGTIKTAASTGSINAMGLGDMGGLNSTALRENVDSCQRQRSTQKQLAFSGKDQKNVSPYRMEKSVNLAGGNVNKLLVGGAHSMLKAKRQISFE